MPESSLTLLGRVLATHQHMLLVSPGGTVVLSETVIGPGLGKRIEIAPKDCFGSPLVFKSVHEAHCQMTQAHAVLSTLDGSHQFRLERCYFSSFVYKYAEHDVDRFYTSILCNDVAYLGGLECTTKPHHVSGPSMTG